MTPTFPTPMHSTTSLHAPVSHDAVMVPRSTFSPCEQLQSELDRQPNNDASTNDFGYSDYQNVVGTHLHDIVLIVVTKVSRVIFFRKYEKTMRMHPETSATTLYNSH